MKTNLRKQLENMINKIGDSGYREINIRGGAVDEFLTLFKEEMEKIIGEDDIKHMTGIFQEYRDELRKEQRQRLHDLMEEKV